jgi:3-phenylpropionate/trans-cinnamate dioxygenase ferredoxin subunit
MAFSKHKWHKIADKETDLQWTSGDVADVIVDGKTFCIARYQQQCFGFAHACPHAGAPLTDGYIDKSCNVVCPVHNLKFNLKTGRDTNGEGYKLKTYPVELRPDGLFIGLDEGGFLKKWF